jgi:nitroimidazol reductase NimA-like FMN-containing flavoprotein (pyridoxamine 5'-phosphate oxidase superfamily)
MLIHELTQAQCREVVERSAVARLACARANQPYIVPISLYPDLDAKCVYGFSTLGQKIDWMRENPKVCLEVEEVADEFHWTTVLVFGRFEEVHDTPPQSHPRRRALDLFQQRKQWWLPAAGKLTSGEEHHTPIVFRIHVDKMTGRRASSDMQSDRSIET